MAIFQLLGTPGEAEWPGVTRLPHWCLLFPRFRARDLAEVSGRGGWVGPRAPCWRRSAAGRGAGCAPLCAAKRPAPLRLRCHPRAPSPPAILPPHPQVVPQLDPAGLDLLARLLCYDPRQRITARQALAHPWLDDVRAAEEARAQASLQAAQALQREMRLVAVAPAAAAGQGAGPSASPAAGAASPAAAGASGASGSGAAPATEAAPAATQAHLLTCEGEGSA